MIFLKEKYQIVLLYILFGFGGLWHILEMFQHLMQWLAGPLMITVSVILVYKVFHSSRKSTRWKKGIWMSGVILLGWAIEYLGVSTGFPFGNYRYGEVLLPQLAGIPIAIGFAWLSITLSSIHIAHIVFIHFKIPSQLRIYFIPLSTALLMVIFDLFMEMTAPALGYWNWEFGFIPLSNYITWFLLGFVFSLIWVILESREEHLPAFTYHVYFSQLLYFLLVIIKFLFNTITN